MPILLLALVAAWVPLDPPAAPPVPASSLGAVAETPLVFVENRGQLDPAVRYRARRGALVTDVRDDALDLTLHRDDRRLGLTLSFVDARDGGAFVGEEPRDTVEHHYRGSEPDGWVERAATFGRLRRPALYPGIDLLLGERDGRIAYDLELRPGADARSIVVRCEGALGLSVDERGRLVVDTALGPLVQSPPVAWETTGSSARPVTARFRLLGDLTYGFDVPDREEGATLVIDPGLGYGSYLGGSFLDRANAIARASNGDLILAGTTSSSDFPATTGAVQENVAGLSDAFVARIDPDAGQLVWATYLGGDNQFPFVVEEALGVAIGPGGDVYVTGRAFSTDFPTTTGVVAETSRGGEDAFVTRLTSGGALVWSTYLGGMRDDVATCLDVDDTGRVLLAGITDSTDFPVTSGAFDETFNSIFFTTDAFVACLAPDAQTVDYGTYIGGQLRDEAFGLAVDGAGAATVVGLTGSADYPTTPGAFDETYNGRSGTETDGFALRLTPSGDALQWSTYYGGFDTVVARDVVLAADGDAVFCGTTKADDLPITAGAWQQQYGGGQSDGFVARLQNDGAALAWSSYLGGSLEDEAHAVALADAGLPTVAGLTRSQDLFIAGTPDRLVDGLGGSGATAGSAGPVTAPGFGDLADGELPGGMSGASDPGLSGEQDAFLIRLSNAGDRVRWGTFYGGSGDEEAQDVVLDPSGRAWAVGESDSDDLPTTANAVDAGFNGVADAFLAGFDVPPFVVIVAATAGRAPRLLGVGEPEVGLDLRVDGARPGAPGWLVVGTTRTALAFRGGTLVTRADVGVAPFVTDADGVAELRLPAPPAGTPLVLQAWTIDPDGPRGLAASDGLSVTVQDP